MTQESRHGRPVEGSRKPRAAEEQALSHAAEPIVPTDLGVLPCHAGGAIAGMVSTYALWDLQAIRFVRSTAPQARL